MLKGKPFPTCDTIDYKANSNLKAKTNVQRIDGYLDCPTGYSPGSFNGSGYYRIYQGSTLKQTLNPDPDDTFAHFNNNVGKGTCYSNQVTTSSYKACLVKGSNDKEMPNYSAGAEYFENTDSDDFWDTCTPKTIHKYVYQDMKKRPNDGATHIIKIEVNGSPHEFRFNMKNL